jgi:hypothetical protein
MQVSRNAESDSFCTLLFDLGAYRLPKRREAARIIRNQDNF